MATFLLTWNPLISPIDREVLDNLLFSPDPSERTTGWSVGSRRGGIAPGDRAYLLRQRIDRGLIASGEFISEVYEAPHWDGTPGKTAFYADVEWDPWLSTDNRLPIEVLIDRLPGFYWQKVQSSGQRIPTTSRTIWSACGSITWRTSSRTSPQRRRRGLSKGTPPP